MKKILLLLLLWSFSLTLWANVIPLPVKTERFPGKYSIEPVMRMRTINETQRQLAELFATQLQSQGVELKYGSLAEKSDISLLLDKSLKDEAYKLNVDSKGITITASDESGFFYGLQTLTQMIDENRCVNYCTVTDYPRFQYRGLMLDVARCFIPKDEVLKIIDIATQLKINRLHLHLVDDNGWRIEIKRYPKLTEVGAWRVSRDEVFPDRTRPREGEKTPVGGFYTQADLKEIIAYAHRRAMEVVPEIEMPAHSVAALASYPELACPTVDRFFGVLPGAGGKDAEIIFCAGNEKVFTFIQNVLDEVMDVFPSQCIHIGGDEAEITNWRACPLCNERVKREHLKGPEELQGYFIRRINNYIKSKGRLTMAWDEVAESNPGDDIILYGWRGDGSAAKKAAKLGHRFVMTPAKTMYFIRYQGPQWFEPYTYFGNNTLKDVYGYEPIQQDWTPQQESLLMGVQGSLWTEFCNSSKDVEYLLFPRVMALADMAWREKGSGEWSDFVASLDGFLPRLDKNGMIHAQSMFNIDHKVSGEKGALKVELSCIRPDVDVRYTVDGSNPDAKSRIYKEALNVKSTQTVKAATFVGTEQKGQTLTLNLCFNKATGKPIEAKPSSASLTVLVNGLRGSDRHSDFEWAGWYNQDATFTVDLQKTEKISHISLGSISNLGMGVVPPRCVEVSVSRDGVNFKSVRTVKFDDAEIYQSNKRIVEIDCGKLEVKAKYVRFVAKNSGIIPAGNAREGQPAWMYFDEITID